METGASAPVIVIDDLLAEAPIEAGKLGHHTVMKSPDARVVVLAFGAGFEMKEHAAPKTLLLQALDGRLSVGVDGRAIELHPGMLMRIEKGERHDVRAIEDSRLMLTLVG